MQPLAKSSPSPGVEAFFTFFNRFFPAMVTLNPGARACTRWLLGIQNGKRGLCGPSTSFSCQIQVKYVNMGKVTNADVNVNAVFDANANGRMGLMKFIPNCKAILAAEELSGKVYEELYGGGTSDETTSSSEVF